MFLAARALKVARKIVIEKGDFPLAGSVVRTAGMMLSDKAKTLENNNDRSGAALLRKLEVKVYNHYSNFLTALALSESPPTLRKSVFEP